MKVLIAGATGLVGSSLMRSLVKNEVELIGISSKDVDLLDRESTFKYISDISPEVLIDAAATVGGIGANHNFPVRFLSNNLRIQTNLIDAAHAAKVEKFIFLGSSCIYPKHAPQPIKESELLNGHLEGTNSAYAIAKIAGIELIKSYRKQYGHKWISLMPANLYGPRDNFDVNTGHVLPSLIAKFHYAKMNNSHEVELWGDGSPFREFLHVDDLASAIIFCIDGFDSEQHLNIGSNEEISIKDLAKLIADIVGFKGSIKWNHNMPNGTPRKILDSTKIKELGWEPKIELSAGIRSTYSWYETHSE